MINFCNLKKYGLIAVALLVLAGCGDRHEKKGKGADSVIARFNGHELRSADVVSYSKLRVALYKLMDPKADEHVLEKVAKSTTSACLPYFIQNSILSDEVNRYKEGHGDYSTKDRNAVRQWLDKQYAEQKSPISSIRHALSKQGLVKQFDKQIDMEIESELYLRIACSNRYPIAEYVITNVYNEWAINNYLAAATNRVILALASNVVKRIKAGEDFQKLADKYTMVPEDLSGGDMGFCSIADFPNEENLWNEFKEFEPGQSTGLIDADDSWQIFKVLERDDTNQQEPKLHLARIYFRRAWEIPRPSRADVVEALEDERRQRLLNEILTMRLKESKIEFPNGKKAFLDITPAKPFLDIIEGRATNLVTQTNGMLQ